jgi:hypothetical protein
VLDGGGGYLFRFYKQQALFTYLQEFFFAGLIQGFGCLARYDLRRVGIIALR